MLPTPFHQLPASVSRSLSMQQGETLFRQGQATSGFYHVVSGAVTLQRTGVDGGCLTLHRAVAGGFFAEASVFSQRYHCDAVCTKAGHVVKIAKDGFVAQLGADPAFAEAFTRLLAQQVQHYRAHIELLAIPSSKERLLAAVQAGYFDATVIELASRINLSHEACYRALRRLCAEGRMVQTGRGCYALA